MTDYKTPGVYVKEIPTLPPSVAGVSTAIPAFIGYTATGKDKVAKIDTLLEYETIFGGAQPSAFTATTNANLTELELTKDESEDKFLMYYNVSLYFKNGGGSCYIVSIGDYDATPAKADFETGLAKLEKEDEPTLILLTDAVSLAPIDYYDLCQQALAQCKKLGDRFAVLDVLNSADAVTEFRNGIGTNNLLYGAAYYPFLQTSLNYSYQEEGIQLTVWQGIFGEDGIIVNYSGDASNTPTVAISTGTDPVSFTVGTDHNLAINNAANKIGKEVLTAWAEWKAISSNDPQGFDIIISGNGEGSVPEVTQAEGLEQLTLADISSNNTNLYNQIKTAMTKQRIMLPPSPAIAGVYASIDRERGVWKAPANVSLASVIGPVSKISHKEQEDLNVDPTAGKSINAIRTFNGKGTLVWGGRTLAGNDNEWRYVSVRRLFNMIEESTRKATAFAVFEPNDAATWLKVKAMIESYLYGLWEQGALAGSTSEAAYFVNVGLGKTMTSQDILEGRMIVEIGIAAVRPAEFIILKFTHKLQEV